MDGSIQIETSEVRLAINKDPNKVIAFDPMSPDFVEAFYNLIAYAQEKLPTVERKAAELDALGLPVDMGERIKAYKQAALYMREQIDKIFGEGTAQMVFGRANNPWAFLQLLEGIAPYVNKARAGKVTPYLAKQQPPVAPPRKRKPRGKNRGHK